MAEPKRALGPGARGDLTPWIAPTDLDATAAPVEQAQSPIAPGRRTRRLSAPATPRVTDSPAPEATDSLDD